MAFASAVALPSCLIGPKKTLFENLKKLPVSSVSGRQRCMTIVAKAVGDGSDSSSESNVKYVQNVWDNPEDRIALVGLGFAGIVAVWASVNLVGVIEKLPLIPGALEFIGILVSWWFIYRYLLFKPDREELAKNVKNSISDILGR